MKVKIDKTQSTRLINCGEVILVSCAYKDKQNITTCAWHMPLSRKPPALAVALAKKHFSSHLIRESGEFVVNIPDWSLLEKVIVCGQFSGWRVDKFKETGFTPLKGEVLTRAPIISECIGWIECSLFDIKEVSDHWLFFGEVVSAQVEGNYFKDGFWDTHRVELIFHLGARYFFKSSAFIESKR